MLSREDRCRAVPAFPATSIRSSPGSRQSIPLPSLDAGSSPRSKAATARNVRRASPNDSRTPASDARLLDRDIAADPHYAARQDIITVDDPTIGPVKQPAVHPRLSATPGRVERGAPKLDEHNREIYAGLLGLSDAELADLQARRII